MPTIAFDRDDLARSLADKLKAAAGERAGSQSVTLTFNDDESELQHQFEGCAWHVQIIFEEMKGAFKNQN